MAPVAGSLKSAAEIVTGTDLITGEEVSRLGAALGIIPGGKAISKGKKVAKMVTKGAKPKAAKRLFEGAPYHGRANKGLKSRGPTNGQEALENSVQVKPTSERRIGVDSNNKEFVVFDQTTDNVFHGHVREWKDLHPDMQNALIQADKVKVVNGTGKIIR
jgi:hypothetical protein